jgi:hypothetical protein
LITDVLTVSDVVTVLGVFKPPSDGSNRECAAMMIDAGPRPAAEGAHETHIGDGCYAPTP